jgi:hypothetical protein
LNSLFLGAKSKTPTNKNSLEVKELELVEEEKDKFEKEEQQ